MDEKLINEAILLGLEVEVWCTFVPSFGRGSRIADELIGVGRIVRQTKLEIILDGGHHYLKSDTEIRIKQK